ncbi:hypothetical protein PIB30_058284 [Stylosanthes scabra]|uniref:Uncharacterized protein n=1 Tax=Stylosanthes scabra TaxID=79078 RepID=A0ABU6WI50_9FABA|nr:hypothetical protein [Stylosanthes scabra]
MHNVSMNSYEARTGRLDRKIRPPTGPSKLKDQKCIQTGETRIKPSGSSQNRRLGQFSKIGPATCPHPHCCSASLNHTHAALVLCLLTKIPITTAGYPHSSALLQLSPRCFRLPLSPSVRTAELILVASSAIAEPLPVAGSHHRRSSTFYRRRASAVVVDSSGPSRRFACGIGRKWCCCFCATGSWLLLCSSGLDHIS